jgi:hypothetical protein
MQANVPEAAASRVNCLQSPPTVAGSGPTYVRFAWRSKQMRTAGRNALWRVAGGERKHSPRSRGAFFGARAIASTSRVIIRSAPDAFKGVP